MLVGNPRYVLPTFLICADFLCCALLRPFPMASCHPVSRELLLSSLCTVFLVGEVVFLVIDVICFDRLSQNNDYDDHYDYYHHRRQ